MKRLATFVMFSVLVLLSGCGGERAGVGNAPVDIPLDPPPSSARVYTALHTFTGGADGKNPNAGLIRDSSGNLYGTTALGGHPSCPDGFGGGCGTIFKVDSSGVLTTLHAFAGGPSDGAFPQGGLIPDTSGNVYGTTGGGGNRFCTQGCGTVFKLDAAGGVTTLHYFTGGAGGLLPNGHLLRDMAGNFYGTTADGGDLACADGVNGCGTVFKLDHDGVLTTLHVFGGGPTDGAIPHSGLILDTGGNLYGTAGGGNQEYGTVFQLDPTGNESVLYHFGGGDGAYPGGALVADEAGNLYGTTAFGGNLDCSVDYFGCGTLFKLDPNGALTTLRVFGNRRNDLSFPSPNLIRDAAGNLYGITFGGGTHKHGALFKFQAKGGETVLYSFIGETEGADRRLGIMDSTGNFYGTAFGGGNTTCDPTNGGCGVVFKIGFP